MRRAQPPSVTLPLELDELDDELELDACTQLSSEQTVPGMAEQSDATMH